MAIDSSNQFFVCVKGDELIIARLPAGRLTKEQALNLAAWLKVLADPGGEKFQELVERIENT